jgi:hypothetical protein
VSARSNLVRSLAKHALAGAAASLLLALVEWVDLNVAQDRVFTSNAERWTFLSYQGLDLVSGAFIGISVGLVAATGSWTIELIARRLTRRLQKPRLRIGLSFLLFGITLALLLDLQPQAHKYILGLLIEAQKLPFLYDDLLSFSSYLIPVVILGLLGACWISWRLPRVIGAASLIVRAGALAGTLVLIAAAYLIDSRYQVQLYEFSLHRSMFLLAQGAAMALVAGIYFSSTRVRKVVSAAGNWPIVLAVALIVVFVSPIAFTLVNFGNSQTLKVVLFTRSTQAKQHFRLFQWVLDFDRDGYSALLGRDDVDDTRGEINPGAAEVLSDGIDNNQMGGDLTVESARQWMGQWQPLHHAQPGIERNRFNLVYVFLDAARADHFGTYGYHRPTTPNFDKLAARSVVFENGFSPAANTFESAPRFMRSTYQDDKGEAWTRILAHNGYGTLLFPEQRLFMLERFVKGARVAAGSDGKPLNESIDVVIDTLSGLPESVPFCAYIYAFDTHMPYNPHEEFNFGSDTMDLYDGELAFTDYHLGRLFDWLDSRGRMKDTIIVIMADHGESLGERGVWRHSSQLYNEQTHVPMIFYLPNCSPRRVQDYVSTIDLGTTILDAVGLQCPKKYTGVSLLPLMHGEPFSHPPVYAEQIVREKDFREVRKEANLNPKLKKYMIISQQGYKLIYTEQYQTFELYNLRDDPGEQNNLYDDLPSVSKELKSELGKFIDIESAGAFAL